METLSWTRLNISLSLCQWSEHEFPERAAAGAPAMHTRNSAHAGLHDPASIIHPRRVSLPTWI